jgi:anti-sigma regulatory factor (Ser/Thr protein kinase)
VKARSEITQFIAAHIAEQQSGLARMVSERFGISRQAANRNIARMVKSGLVLAHGKTRGRQYRLATLGRVHETLAITPELQEDQVWERRVLPLLRDAPENVRDICSYGFTEMVNNAKDHSGSPTLLILAEVTADGVTMVVRDEGVGIFRKIKDALHLEDERHAILELTKGKFTTDPERHTGEGVFFASRMFDSFGIGSGRLGLLHRRDTQDFLSEDRPEHAGTTVVMEAKFVSQHTAKEVFDRYSTEQDDYAFQRTRIVVALAEIEGTKLVSRSQAKRILARLDRFKEVILDFKRVESVGPAFADEMFRVYRCQHPQVNLIPTEANEEVQRMIRRAEAARQTMIPAPGS